MTDAEKRSLAAFLETQTIALDRAKANAATWQQKYDDALSGDKFTIESKVARDQAYRLKSLYENEVKTLETVIADFKEQFDEDMNH